jgi:hypothetical protein
MAKPGPRECDCAPAGSTLWKIGNGSGGKGQQWLFRRGREESQGIHGSLLRGILGSERMDRIH